jgi:hypothetical protein
MHSIFQSPNSRRAAVAAALAALAILGMAACNGPTGGSTEAEGIRLQGRVVGTSGAPVAGVVVTATRTGLLDTTDALGRYVLSAKNADTGTKAAVLDTLRFVKNGQSLAKVTVTTWIEELPDVQVIQRNIVGTLPLGMLFTGRVEFVLRGDGIDSSAPVVTPVYYNALAENYSGFAYFPPSPSVLNYTVYVNVYGPDSALLGRSQTVPFNSFAGDITVPPFSATNAFPVVDAGGPRSVVIGSTVALHGTAADAFGGTIAKWEWSIAGGPFVQTSSGDTVITAPWARGSYACVLRATDNEGNTATSVATLTVTNDSPVLSGLPDTLAVGVNAPASFSLTATDSQGVVRYLWDFNGDGVIEDTTATGTKTHAFPGTPGVSKVIVTAQDAYDGSRKDTVLVFRLPAAGLHWTARSSGTAKMLRGAAWTGSQFVVVGDSGTVLTSPDGTAWTARASGTTDQNLTGVASSGSRIVAVSQRGVTATDSVAYLSDDGGALWVPQNSSMFMGRPTNKVEWLGGRFVARISSSGILVSPDGVTWNSGNGGSGSNTPGVAWNGTQYASLSATLFQYSSNGVDWNASQGTGLGTTIFNGFAWAGDRYVALGGTQVYHSTNGAAWTVAGTTPSVLVMQDLIWTGDLLVAVTATGHTLISPDKGANWIRRDLGAGALRTVVWSGTRLITVGANGRILTSH